MANLFNIIWLTGSFWVPLVFGIIFIFFPFPRGRSRQKYEQIKYIMSAIYLLFAFASLFSLIVNTEYAYYKTIRLFIPLIAVFHIVLFSSINNLLIDNTYSPQKSVPFKLLICTLFGTVYLIAYFSDSKSLLFQISSYVLSLLLVVETTYLSYRFFKNYRLFISDLDNYFSETPLRHLHWVRNSQINLLVAVAVVLLTPLISDNLMVTFLGIIVLFYMVYAIRVIKFADRFFAENNSLNEKSEEQIVSKIVPLQFTELEHALNQWVEEGNYLQPEVTIVNVAADIGTNRTYLSNYLNSYKNLSFKDWVNKLRIEEAQRQILSGKNIPLSDISMNVGYSDQNNFKRHFIKVVGVAPTEWKNEIHKSGETE